MLAVSVRAYGRLEIRSLPDMKLVFWADGFQNGYGLLNNGVCDEDVLEHEENSERVVEVCLTTLRTDGTVPYILATIAFLVFVFFGKKLKFQKCAHK